MGSSRKLTTWHIEQMQTHGVSKALLNLRLFRGWTLEQAVSTPPQKKG